MGLYFEEVVYEPNTTAMDLGVYTFSRSQYFSTRKRKSRLFNVAAYGMALTLAC